MRITITGDRPEKFGENMKGAADAFEKRLTAAANMAASMILAQGKADIAASGNFGDEWTEGLHVDVDSTTDRMVISMTHDIEFAGIFEDGGQIDGNPLLWVPLSGTDAEHIRPGDYPEGLFSIKRQSGTPLLFSMADKMPKYFGIENVTIPKKWHLQEVAQSVMANFRQIFDQAGK